MNFRLRLPNHSSSVRFSSRPPGDEPAQVTSTSRRPKRSIVCPTARSMSSLSVMSPRTPSPRSSPPSPSTARRSVSSSRPVIATRQPSSTSSSAVARPMPRLAPVMKTTWSFSPRSTRVRPFVGSFGHRGKRVAPHLAHPVHRQLVERHHALRAFVRGQALAAVRDERVRVQGARRDDERDDLLAPSLRRHAGDCHPLDRRVPLEDDLDLARVDVETAADDELLAAPRDLEAAVLRVETAEVAGPEPAVPRQRLRRRVRAAPVAGKDLRPADEDLLVVQPQLDARQRPAHATGSPWPVI